MRSPDHAAAIRAVPRRRAQFRQARDDRAMTSGASAFSRPRGRPQATVRSASAEIRPPPRGPSEFIAREGGSSWQEHPRSERAARRAAPRQRGRQQGFAKRPAFGGRGAYRERKPNSKSAPPRRRREKKSGERIAKVLSRAGLASRRDAEEWIVQGRVSVNGRVINSPALDVTASDVITVDGKPLPPRERTRLFCFTSRAG
jgi:23S rRNA pseudouridine2605 synthase